MFAATSCAPAHRAAPSALPAGTLAFNISQDPHSLDPILARSDDERQLAHLAFDQLLEVDDRGRPIPALATEVPTVANGGLSRDGLTITYRLRRDIRWQDGARFTSRDVRFTWLAIVSPDNAVQTARGYDRIASVDATDPWTAVVRLKSRWAPAVASLFTYGSASMPIVPAHLLEGKGPLGRLAFDAHPVGTGPFRFVRWEHDQALEFEANRDYFRGPPGARRIIVRVVPNTNTDLALLRTGELDWSLLSPAQRLALGRSAGLRIRYAQFEGFGAIALNCRPGGFFAARNARLAIAMAIDRRRLSSGITGGQYPVTDSDQPTFSWAFDKTARLPSYDPRMADRLLDDLGWRRDRTGQREKDHHPLRLTFVVFPESDTAVRTAVYVQQMLHERGIDVAIDRVTLARFYLPADRGGALLSGRFDLAYFAWRSGEDPDDSDLVTCGAPANYSGLCDARLDALEVRAVRELDPALRKAVYARVQERLDRQLPYLFLYAPRYGYAVRDELRGFAPTPFSPLWNSYAWSTTTSRSTSRSRR